MSDRNRSRTAEFLKNHPRAMGVLFAIVVALSQAGTVAANGGCGCNGP